MRVGKYLVERKMSLKSFFYLCEYTNLDRLTADSKLQDDKILLLDKAVNQESFQKWMQLKFTADDIQIASATVLLKYLDSRALIDDVTGERILNAILFLIDRGLFIKRKVELLKILSSNQDISHKILDLRFSGNFIQPKTNSNPITKKYKSSYDPYENFSWGGLSGEEAYNGYWNTE